MKYLILSIILSFYSASSIAASTMKCRTKLAVTGDTKSEVIAACGKPDAKEYIGSERVKNKYVKVYNWTYNKKKGKTLVFYGDILKKIKHH